MKENAYQAKLIKKLKETFPGSIVLKNDPNYIQGFPDLTILTKNGWAVLECKREPKARVRPNQGYWVKYCSETLGTRSSFINPTNEEEVLHELQQAL